MGSILKLLCLLAFGNCCSAYQLSTLKTYRIARAVPAFMEMPVAATQLTTLLGRAPEQIEFQMVMDAIEELYDVSEVEFSVGEVKSSPGQNMGSSKIFSFAKISKLDEATTLHLFGDYYRKDVLEHPDGDDHANIRNFMKCGWDGVSFPNGLSLAPKSS
jgi:hypothetical protein